MIRRPPRSTHCISSAASDVYKRQTQDYLVSENWRIWPIVFLVWALAGAAYGASNTSVRSFLLGFGSVTAVVLLFAGNPLEANYNIDRVLFRLVLASVISLACFTTMRIYSQRVEEYRVNRAKKNIGLMAVSTFFLTIIPVSYTHLTLPTICSV